MAGAGGIFRTSHGFPRGAFSFGISSSFAYEVELRAAIFAIKMAWSKG